MIKNYTDYIKENYMVTESVNLTEKEKEFLWSKMEVKKKANAKEKETDVYKILQGNEKIDSEETFIKVLNSLEYSMKKRVKSGEAPKGKYEEAFNSLKKKLPSSWSGVKFSSLTAKKKREDKLPTSKSTKKDIISYLKKNDINFKEEDTKEELLKKVK